MKRRGTIPEGSWLDGREVFWSWSMGQYEVRPALLNYLIPASGQQQHHQPPGNILENERSDIPENTLRSRPSALKSHRNSTTRGLNIHTDPFGRVLKFPYDISSEATTIDHYIDPRKRNLKKLVVQCTKKVYFDEEDEATWQRVEMKNISSWTLRVAMRASTIPRWAKNGYGVIPYLFMTFFQSLCTGFVLIFMVFLPIRTGNIESGGKYPSLHYKFHKLPKWVANSREPYITSKGNIESPENNEPNPDTRTQFLRSKQRILWPPTICVVDETYENFCPVPAERWGEEEPDQEQKYVFIAWSGSSDVSEDNMRHCALKATEALGYRAFYLCNECFPKLESGTSIEEVWQLNDIVRGAHAIAIVSGNSNLDPGDWNEILKGYAKRVWAVPEIALAPAGRDILVYDGNNPDINPLKIAKNEIAKKAWTKDDALIARQLIEHFDNKLPLTRLQLPVLALKLLFRSEIKEHLPGDHAYALSGLLSIRPEVDASDSEFQAFARLSLANDSDRLLERLVCIHPVSPMQSWHDMTDAWNAELWDIEPRCQISAVGDDDTIMIDNAIGASIRWKSFTPVAEVKRLTLLRIISSVLVRLPLALIGPAIYILILGLAEKRDPYLMRRYSPTLAAGEVLLSIIAVIAILFPWMLRLIYSGKNYDSQGWLFGFEGHANLEDIEPYIWGDDQGRLSWSPYFSPLSKHTMNNFGQCIGRDPRPEELQAMNEEAARRQEKIFTLIDTITMTATLFMAARPPVAIVVCGREGGMQRGIGVSYDWTTETLCKETVFRLPTYIIDRMSRIDRFRFAFKRRAVTKLRSEIVTESVQPHSITVDC